MKPIHSAADHSPAWENVLLGASLADQKEDHYRLLLAVSALLELLVDKGIVTREELQRKAEMLDRNPPTLSISAAVPHPTA